MQAICGATCLVALCVVLGSVATMASADLVLASAGHSAYAIVVPDAPSPVEQYAAQELQHFLREMSGVTLPVVAESGYASPGLFLGATRRGRQVVPRRELRDLEEDGVILRAAGQDLVLTGQGTRGPLYAVYELVERFLGVRFLARDCTVVPRRTTVRLTALDHRYAPPFMYRETLYFDSFPREIAARQRLNGPWCQADSSTGGKMVFYPYVHSFSQLVPPAEFYDTHPEYFSLVGGQRTKEIIHGQLCLTNPDVLRIATERVLQWAREHPEATILDVSQNDGNGACECENCMAVVNEEGSQHGPIMRFVNAIAAEVARKYPDRWVETLAYAYATKPGAITRPLPNVIIRLCHAGCYFHGFEACGLGANLSAYLQEWQQRTRRIFIWHYTTNFAHYLAPNPNLLGLAKDIKYYAAHGVNGLMVQGNYQGPGGELAELRQYLAAQLMWDPTRDPMALRQEFCRGYYGRAADDVLTYLALADREAERPDVHAFAAWDPQTTTRPEFVAEALAVLARARDSAGTAEARSRVEKALLPLWYMQLAFPDRYGLASTDAPALLEEFARVVEANAVTYSCEGGDIRAWIEGVRERLKTGGQ